MGQQRSGQTGVLKNAHHFAIKVHRAGQVEQVGLAVHQHCVHAQGAQQVGQHDTRGAHAHNRHFTAVVCVAHAALARWGKLVGGAWVLAQCATRSLIC